MKHSFKRAILAALIFCMSYTIIHAEPINLKYDGKDYVYDLPPISLYINNELVQTTVMPPIQLNERVLVPTREVFQPMGASVEWKPAERKVYVYDGMTLLVLEVDKKEAFVNGEIKTLDVPPKIINDKVMIPMRFISEQLGFKVVWQGGTNRSVSIEKMIPAETVTPMLPVSDPLASGTEGQEMIIDPVQVPVNVPIPNYENTLNHIEYNYEDGTLILEKPPLLSVNSMTVTDIYRERKLIVDLGGDYSQFFDGGNLVGVNGKIKGIAIDNTNGTKLMINTFTIHDLNIFEQDNKIHIQLVKPSEKYNTIVVLDPGHGGSDPGTSGGGLIEKNLNLTFALDTYNLLLNDPNIKVYITRETDVKPSLQERVNIANEIEADLFVSIHNNYIDKTTVNGTETFYFNSSADLRGKGFAQIVQTNIVQTFGMADRKAKPSEYFVVRNTKMPAVLIEVGFLSSSKDRAVLSQPDFSPRLAQVIYQSILTYFQTYGS